MMILKLMKTDSNVVRGFEKKARFWARVLSWIPSLEAIFLSGSLATGNATENSDIDFFIVVTPKTLWTSRFFVFFILGFFGQLSRPHRHRGKICPNHFITRDSLEINEKNDYSAKMFSRNKPLFDRGNVWNDFVKVNRVWISGFGYVFSEAKLDASQRGYMRLFGFWRLFNFFEPLLSYLQRAKIRHAAKGLPLKEGLIFTQSEIRFHPVLKSKNYQNT